VSKPLLSAAMIVRDEARHIGECLASIQGLVDEIVVVDTGSVDETCAIAETYGARVLHEPWQDDFAHARNVALAACTSEWALYIDADERVRPASREALAQLLADPRLGGCFVRLAAKAEQLPYREMRLFRLDPSVRFEGVIHENIWPSLHRYLEATGRGLAESALVLDHVGYDGDQTHKHRRNLPLLLKALERDPQHTYCWYHLGTIRRALGDAEGARAAFLAGIDAVRGRGPALDQDSLVFVELADLDLAEGRDPAPLVAELLERFPDHAHALWLRAQLAIRDGRHEAAEADFLALVAWPESPAAQATFLGYDPRLFGVLAFEGIAACRWAAGDHDEAATWFAKALAAEPDQLEYRIKRDLCRKLAATAA
jgi:glycosyltransferase involved in cell wall biosynthesis